jgi:hypothetical protein
MLAQEVTGERATRPSIAAAELEASVELPPLCERVGWSRRLRGDLDTLILKAIHPEAERRYASAAGLADDIDRFLSGRPIRALPDSRSYRLRKFVARHRVGVFASALGLAGLLLGFAVALWHANRAQLIASEAQAAQAQLAAQLAHAERMRSFLLHHIVAARDAEALVALAARLDQDLADDPRVQGELRVAIGEALVALDARDSGEALIARGRAQLRTDPR